MIANKEPMLEFIKRGEVVIAASPGEIQLGALKKFRGNG